MNVHCTESLGLAMFQDDMECTFVFTGGRENEKIRYLNFALLNRKKNKFHIALSQCQLGTFRTVVSNRPLHLQFSNVQIRDLLHQIDK
jgi:hypothetical protein